jgi:ribosomal protein S18 acetylase RimI-like enzyme
MTPRAPTPEDAARIARVHVASWQAGYRHLMPWKFLANLSVEDRAAMWAQCIAKGQPWLLVVEVDGEVVGFVAYGKARGATDDEDTGEIWAIYVDPQHWAKSAGKALLGAAVDDLRQRGFGQIVLWAIVGNERADRFYTRAGFVRDTAARREFGIAGVKLQEDRYLRAMAPDAV